MTEVKADKSVGGYIKSAGILTIGLIVSKGIGALYRIPLSNLLGAEGMGVYQLIFPIYSFLLTASSGALPVAISAIVSERLATGDEEGARKLLNTAMSVLLVTGAVIMVLLMALAKPIGYIQGSKDTLLGYIAIAPSIFAVSGISALRGWFQGKTNMIPSAISQITEATIKLIFGLGLGYLFIDYGIRMAVFGSFLGITISELGTFLALYIIFRKNAPPIKLSLKVKDVKDDYKRLLKLSVPITIGGLILPFSQIIDSLLVVNILVKYGSTPQQATASYGLFSGYVSTLISLPIALGLALGVAVIPQISQSKAEHNAVDIKQKCISAIKLALVVGIPFFIVYVLLGENVLNLLYPSLKDESLKTATRLLQIGAIDVITLSVTQILTSILQGIGYTYKPVINMSIGAFVKILLDVILIPYIGILGVQTASLACFMITLILNGYTVTVLLGKSNELVKNSGIIMALGVIMCVLILVVRRYMIGKIAVFGLAIPSMLLYAVGLLACGVLNKEELKSIPFGEKLARLMQKIFRRKNNV